MVGTDRAALGKRGRTLGAELGKLLMKFLWAVMWASEMLNLPWTDWEDRNTGAEAC